MTLTPEEYAEMVRDMVEDGELSEELAEYLLSSLV